MDIELVSKVIDTEINTIIPNTGNVSLLNGIANGFSYFNRVGIQTYNEFLEYRLNIDEGVAATPANNTTRISFVIDEQVNGALPSYSDIFQDTSSTSNYTSPINWNNQDRFTIIGDFYIDSNTQNELKNTITGAYNLQFITQFTGTGNGIANINTKALYIVSCSSSAAGSQPTLFGTTRIHYDDN